MDYRRIGFSNIILTNISTARAQDKNCAQESFSLFIFNSKRITITYLLQLVFCRFLDLTHLNMSPINSLSCFLFRIYHALWKRAYLGAKYFIDSLTLLSDVTMERTHAHCYQPIRNKPCNVLLISKRLAKALKALSNSECCVWVGSMIVITNRSFWREWFVIFSSINK